MSRTQPFVRYWIAIASVLICCRVPVEVRAGSGEIIVAPNPAEPATHGIRLTIDPYWVEGFGYRPIRVKATAVSKEDFDRTISVQVLVDDAHWRRSQVDMTVTQDFVLPAGASEANTTIAVPQYREWNRIGWNVLVDGSFAEELSFAFLSGPSQGVGGLNSGQPGVLYVDSASPVRAATPIPVSGGQSRRLTPTVTTMATATLGANAATVVPGDLPTRWLDYSCLDIVQLSATELKKVVENQEPAWKAIRQWLAAGGNLVVYGIPTDGDWNEETNRLDAFLGERPDSRGPRPAVGWQRQPEPPAKASPSQELRVGPGERVIYADGYGDEEQSSFQPLQEDFQWRDYQLGTVLISKRATPIRYESNPQLEPPSYHRQFWTLRHGVSPQLGTVDFLNLLIPGVGLAPVGMFRILITLFVIVIGPVNFFLLRRWRRFHLMLFTVPICAALVTAALFAYALLTDGLGTRVRMRSFTEIDQRRGTAASWSRQSYYAGIAPRGGMKLSDDAMVVPLKQLSWYGWNGGDDSNVRREMQWTAAGGQHLARGWLSSRTPTQYLIVRSGDCEKKISVSSQQGRAAVKNQLDATIVALLLFDESGEGYWGEEITADAAVRQLSPIAGPQASAKLAVLFRENEPSFPPNMEDGEALLGMSRGYYRGGWSQEQAPTMFNSRLEQSLRKYGPAYPLNLEPGTYLAIVDRSPEVAIGVEGATEESSFHVILGRY